MGSIIKNHKKRAFVVCSILCVCTIVVVALSLHTLGVKEYILLFKFNCVSGKEKVSIAMQLGLLRSLRFRDELKEVGQKAANEILKKGVKKEEINFQCLLQSGVIGYPAVFSVWLKTRNPEVLIMWMESISIDQMGQKYENMVENMEEEDSIREGFSFYATYAEHSLLVVNPILPYEEVFGKGTWPPEISLDVIRKNSGSG